MEDKDLVGKILHDRNVVRNERQQQEFDALQAGNCCGASEASEQQFINKM